MRKILILLAALAVAPAAHAETIYLQCGNSRYEVDLANSTVNNFPATINTTSIDWTISNQSQNLTRNYHIDRVGGTFSATGTWVTAPQPCTKGSAPATRF